MEQKLSLMTRLSSSTPKWFKTIRNVGIVLTGISTAIIASPVALPAIAATIASYCAVGGIIAAAIAQTAVEGN
jgi:hypothetical protein